MTFLDRLYLPKFNFSWNLSDGKIIKFQQRQASTSHFESFWSIVKGIFDSCTYFLWNQIIMETFILQMDRSFRHCHSVIKWPDSWQWGLESLWPSTHIFQCTLLFFFDKSQTLWNNNNCYLPIFFKEKKNQKMKSLILGCLIYQFKIYYYYLPILAWDRSKKLFQKMH